MAPTTRGVEDYLGQIKRLEEDGQRCTATVLAQSLGVSLPSASEMLKRLANEGYLERAKDGAVKLTAAGRRPAHEVLRRHRLVERLLTDLLGMPWHQAHGEAHRLEHGISRRVEERLAEVLGYPEYCPHGHPICPVDPRSIRPLDSVEEGEEVAVAQISEIKEDLLAYFDQVGLVPGHTFKIVSTSAFGPMSLQTTAGPVSISKEVAVFVQVCDPEEADWVTRTAFAPRRSGSG